MPLWNMPDNPNAAPISIGAQFNVTPNTVNRDALYGNTTANAYIAGVTVGVFSVSDAEKNSANVSSEASKVAHTGWQIRTVGQGGRAGRVFYETLVAGAPTDGANTTFDDSILP